MNPLRHHPQPRSARPFDSHRFAHEPTSVADQDSSKICQSSDLRGLSVDDLEFSSAGPKKSEASYPRAAMTDQDLIRNVVARYSHCLDDRRFKEWSETFTEDGVFGNRTGRAAIYENILGGELATIPELQRRHIVTNLEIAINGDTAEVTSDLLMYDKRGDGPWTLRVGRYYDTLRRETDGEWRFTVRRLEWVA